MSLKLLPALLALPLAMLVALPARAGLPQRVLAANNFSASAGDWLEASNGLPVLDANDGDRAPSLRMALGNVGLEAVTFNTRDPAWRAALVAAPSIEIGLTANTRSIQFQGHQVPRDLIVMIRDYTHAEGGYPYTAVWAKVGTLVRWNAPWKHMSVVIPDTTATTLPAGWGGYGAEDALGNPVLPAGRSFADVLANAEEISFTTLVPGWGYSMDVFWDVSIDNVFILRKRTK